jgi:hypothetical protein
VELAVVNSLGMEAYQLYSDLFFHLIMGDGKGSGYASFVSRDPDRLNIESLAEEATRRASGGEPIQIEPGSMRSSWNPMLSVSFSHSWVIWVSCIGAAEGRSFFCDAMGKSWWVKSNHL